MSTSSPTMRAFVLHGHGNFDSLRFHKNWPRPKLQENHVLLRVKACGLNNTDVNTRTGWYSKSVSGATSGAATGGRVQDGGWDGCINFPIIQGGDIVGVVEKVAAGVNKNLIGKRCLVSPIVRDWQKPMCYELCQYIGSAVDGGFAEYVAVDYRNVYPINCQWSDAELATIPISYSTAENLLSRLNVSKNDLVLITGASGGVGSALLQLANRRGACTIACASESKHEFLRGLNPSLLLPRQPKNLKTILKNKFGSESVSVIIDVVGGNHFAPLLEVLQRGGRYGCSGAIAGAMVKLDLRTLYLHDLTFVGCTIFSPQVFTNLIKYIESGEIKPLLSKIYPLEKLHEAQSAFIEKSHVGNIVVRCGAPEGI